MSTKTDEAKRARWLLVGGDVEIVDGRVALAPRFAAQRRTSTYPLDIA